MRTIIISSIIWISQGLSYARALVIGPRDRYQGLSVIFADRCHRTVARARELKDFGLISPRLISSAPSAFKSNGGCRIYEQDRVMI
ncbi:hypothetical protein BC939DRAFT_443104 [Gamsiella multidivaricata]|uniref:uncharacterized protein n=1 Tax=Gamsiella multidivaricata TaxID=101098 RepID=UPI00221FAA37|nr:uncharacterized protein BC939DRAFT_443104 [Gamsiella multidivaricata]KAI7828849.1 hypothetical protein BC939DRAFT_443104 [Gamsiella multidivaricata]